MCQATCWVQGAQCHTHGRQGPRAHEAYVLERRLQARRKHLWTAGGTRDKGHRRGAEGVWERAISGRELKEGRKGTTGDRGESTFS